MRQEPLTGYVLHAKAYQEKRAIYQYFSLEHGMVHGVGMRGVPSFVLVSLFAGGQSALKSFSQLTITEQHMTHHRGQSQYALLYLNEILCRLLAIENPCPDIWHSYQDSVRALVDLGVVGTGDEQKNLALRLVLRAFERQLFEELGVGLYFVDEHGDELSEEAEYAFVVGTGFVKMSDDTATQNTTAQNPILQNPIKNSTLHYHGKQLQEMANAENEPAIYAQYLREFGQIQRMIMDDLLDYKPLNSRKLWQQNLRYQSAL